MDILNERPTGDDATKFDEFIIECVNDGIHYCPVCDQSFASTPNSHHFGLFNRDPTELKARPPKFNHDSVGFKRMQSQVGLESMISEHQTLFELNRANRADFKEQTTKNFASWTRLQNEKKEARARTENGDSNQPLHKAARLG